MKSLKLLLLLLLILNLIYCNKEPLTETQPEHEIFELDVTSLQTEFRNVECEDGLTTVTGKGNSLAEARADYGAKARVNCYAHCGPKTCEDDEEKCALTKVQPIGQEQIVITEDPTNGKDIFCITVAIKCHCDCRKCNGQKLVGRIETGMGPTQAQALAMARASALAWCKSTACPGFNPCKDGKTCQGRGSSGTVLSSTSDQTGMWTVRLLVEKCRCLCAKAGSSD